MVLPSVCYILIDLAQVKRFVCTYVLVTSHVICPKKEKVMALKSGHPFFVSLVDKITFLFWFS